MDGAFCRLSASLSENWAFFKMRKMDKTWQVRFRILHYQAAYAHLPGRIYFA
jgi:hypothetical protein